MYSIISKFNIMSTHFSLVTVSSTGIISLLPSNVKAEQNMGWLGNVSKD
jgi:hypothetical protein